MNTIQGPGIFLAQFIRDEPPYDSLAGITGWAKDLGYRAVQIPTWDERVFNLERASESKAYCREIKGTLSEIGLEISEITAHLQGQAVAMSSVYETAFQPFYPPGLGDRARLEWATKQIKSAIIASSYLGLETVPVLSGGFAWHMVYPWPQRPAGLVEEAFRELSERWLPILDFASEYGQKIAFELHPGSDLFDGATFERFLESSGNHPAVQINYDPSHFLLQQIDYLEFIRTYGDWIAGFHVKDAEFRPSGRVGVYGGYLPWRERAGRFRSLGDGQVDFKQVFSRLTESGFGGWAVLEWECCIKSPEQGAREGASFIRDHIIQATRVAFDDFVGSESDTRFNRKILGLQNEE